MRRRFCLSLLTLLLVACAPIAANPPTAVPLLTPATLPTAAIAASTAARPTETSVATALPAPTVAPVATVDDLAQLAALAPEPRDQIALVEAFKATGAIPAVVRATPLAVKVGDVESFWVADVQKGTNYQVQARLRYAGPVALMYIDTQLDAKIAQADIERSAKTFEEKIYPRDRALFGNESSPGIDGDPRLTILNIALRGAGGYFSASDTVPKQVNRFSNERDMFVIGVNSYPIGDDSYASTLAHEFQHMIEWNVVRRSPTWFNEGMSTLAQDLNGYPEDRLAAGHIATPDIQLTGWATDAAQNGRHYGTSNLFLRYFHAQYGGDAAISELVKRDAGNHPDVFVEIAQRIRPEIRNFADLVADWAVANMLDDAKVANGRYSYNTLPETIQPEPAHQADDTTVSQFGADYLSLPTGPIALRFDGSTTVPLVGAKPHSGRYAWWSDRGDDSVQTLTRAFDLRGVSAATLGFALWHEIELDYDYGFVSASTDGGATWQALKGNTTTDADPQGQNFGSGITGVSGTSGASTDGDTRGQWIDEQIDLAQFVGKQILLRFWLVSDVAYNAPGMLVDDIRIPALNYADDVEQGDGGWQAVGFARTTGVLPQEWALRLVRERSMGTTVELVPVDAQGYAGIVLAGGERGMLMVMGSTPFTTESARYSYTIEQR